MSNKPSNPYRVIYDLNYAPLTFDFGHFLAISEARRQLSSIKSEGIHLTILADFYREVTDRDKITKGYEKDWRLKNIILGCCSILPTIKDIHLITDVNEVYKRPYDWPRGYNSEISETRSQFPNFDRESKSLPCSAQNMIEMHKVGVNPSVLKASSYAKALAKGITPKKYFTLTLRTSWLFSDRNINLDDWHKFYEFLLGEGHDVVVIADHEDYFSGKAYKGYDWEVCDAACLNVELRMAVYEAAQLNFCSSNGPAALMYFSNAKFLQFDQLRADHLGKNFWLKVNGIPVGESFPWFNNLQKLVWKDSSFETLKEEYLAVESSL